MFIHSINLAYLHIFFFFFTASDSATSCTSAAVHTMAEEIKKQLTYNETVPFQCVMPQVTILVDWIRFLHSRMPSPVFALRVVVKTWMTLVTVAQCSDINLALTLLLLSPALIVTVFLLLDSNRGSVWGESCRELGAGLQRVVRQGHAARYETVRLTRY